MKNCGRVSSNWKSLEKFVFKVPEEFRVFTGPMKSSKEDGNNGVFILRTRRLKNTLSVQASDGADWEHASVSLAFRTPTWSEMHFVKNLFWDADDLVVQFHPPESEYVDIHKYCLHLWRKIGTNDYCETPPTIMV